MAERERPARDRQAAEVWRAYHGCSVGVRDAAIIKKLQLKAFDTEILVVGCGYGSLLIALYKCIRAMTDRPAHIVGIDYCRPLLDEAIQWINGLQGPDHSDIADTVKVHMMNVLDLNSPPNLARLRSCFPRGPDGGPKIIIVVGVFDDLANPTAQAAIRNLAALQPHGGRLILGSQYQPACCGSAYLFENIRGQARVVGILNLVPPECMQKPEHDTAQAVQQVAGRSPILHVGDEDRRRRLMPGDPPVPNHQEVTIHVSSCEVMGKVLEEFAGDAGTRVRGLSVQLGHEACFFRLNPLPHRIVNTSHPVIRYIDTSAEFINAAADRVAPLERELQVRLVPDQPAYSVPKVKGNLVQLARDYDGADQIRLFFCGYLHPDRPCNSFDLAPQIRDATEVIQNARAEVISAPFGGNWQWFQVQPLSVLTSFYKT